MIEDFPSLNLTTNSFAMSQLCTSSVCVRACITFPLWLGIQQVAFFPFGETSMGYSFNASPSECMEAWNPESFMAQWGWLRVLVRGISVNGFWSMWGGAQARHEWRWALGASLRAARYPRTRRSLCIIQVSRSSVGTFIVDPHLSP